MFELSNGLTRTGKKQGCGGFLNPPTHPEHTNSVVGRDFIISLSTAAKADWLADDVREKAAKLLTDWENNKPAIDMEWVRQVLAYFNGCYRGEGDEGVCWQASNLRIDMKIDPLYNADVHAGVHWIRSFYPDYHPVRDDFGGVWGEVRPSQKVI